MSKDEEDEFFDFYQGNHTVDAINPRHFFKGYHIISDQIEKEALGVIWDELKTVLLKLVPGDIVEFGCYVGTTSVFIRRGLDAASQSDERTFHVYDSFQGLPEKTAQDTSAAGVDFRQGALRVSKREFIRQFQRAALKMPTIHKGWFSDLTEKDVPEKIAFAFLDGDFYESIRDSLKLVLPRMQQGGTIIIDDYAREALPGAAKATHELVPRSRIMTNHNLGIIHF